MANQNQLTKTCINCGLQKQISAFLQISGPGGTSYGNICSTCRGSGLGKSIVIPETESEERHSSGSTGLKIDAKSKVHIDTENKLRQQNKQEVDIKETKKRDLTKEDLLDRQEKKLEAEQKHRQSYIEPKKKEGFLNYQSKKPLQKQLITATEKAAIIKKSALDQHGILETLHKEVLAKHEEKVKGTDLVNIDIDLSQPLEKLRSAEFNKAAKAQAWLRTGATLSTSKFLAKNPAAQKTAELSNHTLDNQDEALADALNEIFEPNSPGSRRR